jgi:hypothetical protein
MPDTALRGFTERHAFCGPTIRLLSKSLEGRRHAEIQTQRADGGCPGRRLFATNAYAETTLNALFMAQAAYSEADVRAMTDAFAKANPDVKVNLEFVPYEGLHDKTVLAQGSGGGYDVVLFDVIWPAEYASNKVLVDVSSRVTDDMKKNVLPGAWTTVQYDGAYYGMPWILDTKYLFYNKEILEKAGIKTPPKTWDELPSRPRPSRTRAFWPPRSPGAGRRPKPRFATTPRWSAPMGRLS